MKLESEHLDFASVTEAQLRQAFEDDDQRGNFVTLSQDTDQYYMQASGEGDGPYQLEYREADADHHYEAGVECSKADVLRAFQSYLANDDKWRTQYSWQLMDMKPKPWWKVW